MDDAKGLVIEYLERQRRFKEEESSFNEFKDAFKKKVRGLMEKAGRNKLVFDCGDKGKYSLADVRQTKVTFDTGKLKQKLPDVYGKVVVKDRHVEDWEGFVGYMKKLGADPKLVASFLKVDESVDRAAVDAMVDSGDLTLEQLEGCYSVSVNDGYIKVTEMET